MTLRQRAWSATWMVLVYGGHVQCQCKHNTWRGHICWMNVLVLFEIARMHCQVSRPSSKDLVQFVLAQVLTVRTDCQYFNLLGGGTSSQISGLLDGARVFDASENFGLTYESMDEEDFSTMQPIASPPSDRALAEALKGIRKLQEIQSPEVVERASVGQHPRILDSLVQQATGVIAAQHFDTPAGKRSMDYRTAYMALLENVLLAAPHDAEVIAMLGESIDVFALS